MGKSALLRSILLMVACHQVVGQPATRTCIEVLRDVRIEPQVFGRAGEKGRLDYFRSSTASPVVIDLVQGQRFEMVLELGEGSCRIEIERQSFDLQSCPWLPGFVSRQDDVYRVVTE
jgi:hypothetical protein